MIYLFWILLCFYSKYDLRALVSALLMLVFEKNELNSLEKFTTRFVSKIYILYQLSKKKTMQSIIWQYPLHYITNFKWTFYNKITKTWTSFSKHTNCSKASYTYQFYLFYWRVSNVLNHTHKFVVFHHMLTWKIPKYYQVISYHVMSYHII